MRDKELCEFGLDGCVGSGGHGVLGRWRGWCMALAGPLGWGSADNSLPSHKTHQPTSMMNAHTSQHQCLVADSAYSQTPASLDENSDSGQHTGYGQDLRIHQHASTLTHHQGSVIKVMASALYLGVWWVSSVSTRPRRAWGLGTAQPASGWPLPVSSMSARYWPHHWHWAIAS